MDWCVIKKAVVRVIIFTKGVKRKRMKISAESVVEPKKKCHKSTARISKVFTKDVWNASPQAHCRSNIMQHWLIYCAEQSWCCLHNLKHTHYHCHQFLCCFCWAVIQHSFNLTPKREIKWCQVTGCCRGQEIGPPHPIQCWGNVASKQL